MLQMRTLARAGFFVLALPAVMRASARVAWLHRRLPLDELAVRLRSTPRFTLPPLANPEWLLATLDRVLPLLPPRALRPLPQALAAAARPLVALRLAPATPPGGADRACSRRSRRSRVGDREPGFAAALPAPALGTSSEGYRRRSSSERRSPPSGE